MKSIKDIMNSYAYQNEVNLIFVAIPQDVQIYIDPDVIYSVIQLLMSTSINLTEPTGTV